MAVAIHRYAAVQLLSIFQAESLKNACKWSSWTCNAEVCLSLFLLLIHKLHRISFYLTSTFKTCSVAIWEGKPDFHFTLEKNLKLQSWVQYVLFLKFAYTKSLEYNWWLNHPPKVHVKTT